MNYLTLAKKWFIFLGKHFHVLFILGLVTVTLLLGTLGFAYFEEDSNGKSMDHDTAFYLTITTVTTVGYGDFSPETSGGRVVFYTVAMLGIGTISFGLGTLTSNILEAELMKMNGMGKTKRKGHTIIVGWNEVTAATHIELSARGDRIVVIDDDENAPEMLAMGIEFIKGDPKDTSVLKRGGLDKASIILIPIESDEETLLIAMKARRLNPKISIVVTCDDPDNNGMMKDAGIDVVIPQSEIIGTLLGNATKEMDTINFISEILRVEEGIDLESRIIPEKKKSNEFLDAEKQKLIAYKRKGKTRIAFSDEVDLEAGDVIYYLDRRESEDII